MDPSNNTEKVVAKLRKRSLFGQEKYKVSMDRQDLTLTQWANHFQEEMMDGAEYAERVLEGVGMLESAADLMCRITGRLPESDALVKDVTNWLSRYRATFVDSSGREVKS